MLLQRCGEAASVFCRLDTNTDDISKKTIQNHYSHVFRSPVLSSSYKLVRGLKSICMRCLLTPGSKNCTEIARIVYKLISNLTPHVLLLSFLYAQI